MDDQFITLLVSLFTQDVQMVHLSLMVISRKWSGTKFGLDYRQIYLNRPDPNVFIPVVLDVTPPNRTTGHPSPVSY
jgi:hypothetical protein